MSDLLYSLWMSVIRPIKVSEYFYKLDNKRVLDDTDWDGMRSAIIRPNFYELLLLLWISFTISSFQSFSIADFTTAGFWISTKTLTIFGSILIYPLMLILQLYVWKFIIKIAMKLFDFKEIDDNQIRTVIEFTFLSGLFALVPYIGEILTVLSFYTNMYAGLTRNLRLRGIEAMLTILTPTVVLLTAIALILWIIRY